MNALDFGAKGDGKTDDTAALQAIIDHGCKEGGIIDLPAGVYLTKPLVYDKQPDSPPFILRGAGRNMQLQITGQAGTMLQYNYAYGGTVLTLRALNGGGLEGIAIDGGGQAACGLLVDCAVGAHFQSIQVRGTYGYGFVFQASAAGCYRNTLIGLGTDASCGGGLLLTGTNANVDVAQCAFVRTDLRYNGALAGLDLASADNVDFFGLAIQAEPSATGPLIWYRGKDGPRLGASYTRMHGVDGNGRPIRVDSPGPNLIVGLSHGNGIPGACEGRHPEALTVLGWQ